MNWRAIKQRFSLFDKTGMDAGTIRTLQVMIYAVMGGVIWSNITGGIAMTGYMKELGASDFLYGIIIALPSLANAFQFLVSYWMEKTLKRTKLFILCGLIQRLIWLPAALAPFIIPMSQPQLRLWVVVVCVSISAIMAPMMNVSFISLCADVVPMRIRGRYFATRSRISSFAGLVVGLIVGVLLDKLPGFQGYCVVFIIASVAGLIDICAFFFTKLPQMRATPGTSNLFRMLKTVLSDKRYMKTVLCVTLWLFSVQLCAPYFNVYMLENMRMTNFEITLYGSVVGSLFLILFIQRWGGALDQYGARPVLHIATCLTSFVPFIYGFTGPGMLSLIVLSSALSGAIYCAVDLSAQNLYMGQAKEENKSMYFAVYFIFTQLCGLALGSAAGGWLLDNVLWRPESLGIHVAGVFLSRYNWLFLIAWALRFAISLLVIPRISEEDAQSTRALIAAGRVSLINKLSLLKAAAIRHLERRKYDRMIRQKEEHDE